MTAFRSHIRSSAAIVLMAMLTTGPALGQSSVDSVRIDQIGDLKAQTDSCLGGNCAAANITGDDNSVGINQSGSGNVVNVAVGASDLVGNGNGVSVTQSSRPSSPAGANQAHIQVSGTSNTANVEQSIGDISDAYSNVATVYQDGSDNRTAISQETAGSPLVDGAFWHTNLACGNKGNCARVWQIGDRNETTISQTGYNNVALSVQRGDDNSATITQDNTASGADRTSLRAAIYQQGNGFSTSITQTSPSDAAVQAGGGIEVRRYGCAVGSCGLSITTTQGGAP